jgi:DNA-binding PadR family transcriptional regulator
MSRTERNPLTMEHALLGFLRQRPMHGYEIYQHLTDPHGLWLVWRMKQSQLYALLAKLEAEEYITSSLHPQDARPPRKVYKLTRTGRGRFLAWMRSPVPHGRELRQDFLAKLYFALQDAPAVTAELIDGQRAACRSWLLAMQAPERDDLNDRSFAGLVGRFRLGQIESMLKWLDVCERTLALAPARS